ncbi:TetR/AcrR family transcriptional regulator [Puteibacter caeruleilacunae]|nr:TetR/AcrR family transcriptional regulator [Puteibacter caeruleilacunae]
MEATKERILKTAVKLFAENGFDGTSVRAITSTADVNLAMISYYFKSKEGVLKEIFDVHAETFQNKVNSIEGTPNLTPREKLDQLVEAATRLTIEEHDFTRIFDVEIAVQRRPELVKHMEKRITEFGDYLQNLITQCNPSLSKATAASIATVLFASVSKVICNPSLHLDSILPGIKKQSYYSKKTKEALKAHFVPFHKHLIEAFLDK